MFFMPQAFFIYVYVIPLGVLYWEHSQLAFSTMLSLLEASNLLGQGPQWCGLGLFDNLFGVRPSPTEHGLHALSPSPLGLELTTTPLALVKLHHHY